MLRRWLALVLPGAVLACAAAPASAPAAVRTGSVEDPADVVEGVDVAEVGVRYDEAGAIELRVRFHRPVEPGTDTVLDWIVLRADVAEGCGDTWDGLAGLVDLGAGRAELTYSEPSDTGIPEQIEVPATQAISADRRALSVRAASDVLAGRDLRCSLLTPSDGADEVAPFALERARPADATPVPQPGADTDGAPPAAGPVRRLSTPRLHVRRRARTIVATVRTTVCAPPGSRLTFVVRETRGRLGPPAGGGLHRHRFDRPQRTDCQPHRLRWRFRAHPRTVYEVAANVVLRVTPPPEQVVAGVAAQG